MRLQYLSAVAGLVLIGGVVFVGLQGCGARGEVAKEVVLEKIDSLLGKLEVQRKEIGISIEGMEKAVTGLRKAKIKAEVRQDQLNRQIEPLETKQASIDSTLSKLREHLTANEPTEIGGKTYTVEDMKSMAQKLIDARKELNAQIERLRGPIAQMAKVAETLGRKQADYEARLADLESQVAEIDAKKIALDAMKEASRQMGATDEALASNVGKLESDIADLNAEVETQLRVEDELWDEAAAEKEMESVDSIIQAMKPPEDIISEIDAVLGTANE